MGALFFFVFFKNPHNEVYEGELNYSQFKHLHLLTEPLDNVGCWTWREEQVLLLEVKKESTDPVASGQSDATLRFSRVLFGTTLRRPPVPECCARWSAVAKSRRTYAQTYRRGARPLKLSQVWFNANVCPHQQQDMLTGAVLSLFIFASQ